MEADCLVAIGGGSTTGLGKAIALRTDLPQIVIPTTYAGSEATPILGETVEGRKTTQRSPRILPEIVLYDIDLTLTLPVELSITSGFNAIAHAAEALYAPNGNPLIDGLAEQGITAMCRALPLLRRQPVDASARSDALYGAWACGMCLGATDMGLHHKLCHTLGGAFDLPHAEMHTVLLPHTLAYNSSAVPDAMRRIAAAASVADAPQGLFDLQRKLGAPQSLEALGMPFDGIAEAARLATENAYRNPREITSAGIEKLLSRAFAGNRPLSE
ncbi:maleylacetate reductase [Novosphingobium sp. ST904]|uniref:maleylacetate reductase n=1 Tax=Novosphingobium sp. ST904 TaxID=1684385 RepID=UPI0035187123